jgi:Domain of unknown function (DUF4372)/Transposase DDE domain
MPVQETIFAQLLQLVDHNELKRCIDRYEGNSRVKTFTCQDQFLCMIFAQLAEKKSLRSTLFSLQRMESRLYHMGIRGRVSLSALSDANARRNWQIWQDYAKSLITQAGKLYTDEKLSIDEEIENTVYAFDSSTVDLCLSLFRWARFRKTKAGIKLHTMIDLRGIIPVYIDITEAKVNDVKALDWLTPELGSIYLFDRGYLDFSRLYKFTLVGAFFVTRTKHNTRFSRLYSNPVDKSTGLICDQIGVLSLKKAMRTILKSCAA